MRGKEDRGRAMKEEKREWKREGKGFPQKPNLRRRYIRTCFLGFCQHECPCSSWVCRCLQVQFLPYYYSYLEPTAGWCRYVAFHRGLQVSIDGHLGDSDVNLETFILFYLTLQHVFICLCNLDFSVAFSNSCTSAMHDITQLWGMCIIGKEEEGR